MTSPTPFVQDARSAENRTDKEVRLHLDSPVLSGAVFGLSAGLSPGPLLTLVVAQTLRHGPREGFKVAAAPMVTDLPIVVGAVLLMAPLSRMAPILGAISLAGAAYCGYLGWQTMACGAVTDLTQSREPRSLRQGVVVNFLNPHPYLFWTILGGPLLIKTWEASAWSAGIFLLLFYGCLVGSKMVLAVAVGHGRRILQGSAYRWVLRGLGLALLGFAVALARDGIRRLA